MVRLFLLVLLSLVACSSSNCASQQKCDSMEDQLTLLQSAARIDADVQQHGQLQLESVSEHTNVPLHTPVERRPLSLLHSETATASTGSFMAWYRRIAPSTVSSVQLGLTFGGLMMAMLGLKFFFPGSAAIGAISLGAVYIVCSALMIESNKWLMLPGHFPYPLTLTTNHMLMSFVLANCLRLVCPSAFPSSEKVEVSWWFLLKFVPIGAAFALSIVCGNGAYGYLSVSFLQCMKQWNIAIIYFFSVLCGLEAMRRCSIILLAGTLCGTFLAIHGELHFELIGFLLQVVSSLSEATKVIIQSLLMSGSLKLDPLTMVLFMAPACLLANLVPLAVVELPRFGEISTQLMTHLPFVLFNACLAFGLNVIVAQCIKRLSAVGYLLCGIVKDVCIIVTSSFFLGESLATMQIFGFCLALSGVASYSLYKQNPDCFDDDNLINGFVRVAKLGSGKDSAGGDSKNAEK